jgi:hypothetical protein
MGARCQTGGRAFGVGIIVSAGFACIFFQDRLAASHLGDHCVQFLAVFGDSAVSNVVAIPTGGRIERIELGQIELGDSSGEAVDQQPASALPLPARGVGGLRGQSIVYAKDAADYEQAIGQLMRSSGRVFFEPGVDKQRAHFQVEELLSGGVWPFGGNPFSKSDDVRFGDGGAFGQQQIEHKERE